MWVIELFLFICCAPALRNLRNTLFMHHKANCLRFPRKLNFVTVCNYALILVIILSWIGLMSLLSQSTALCFLLLASFPLLGNFIISSSTLLQLYIFQDPLSWYCFSIMVSNPHYLWYCFTITVFAIQNSVILQLQFHYLWYCFTITVFAIQNSVILQLQFLCIGKKIIFFHWFKSNPTLKLLLILKDRNCNFVFKVMLVKLQNQIEERELSY